MASNAGEWVTGTEVGLATGWYIGIAGEPGWSWYDEGQGGFAPAHFATRYGGRGEAERFLADSDIGTWRPDARVVEVV